MKPITFLFNGIAFAFCLSVPACSSTDNFATGPDAAKHHQYPNTGGKESISDSNNFVSENYNYGTGHASDGGSRPNRTFDMTVSAPVLPDNGNSSDESDQDSAVPNSESSEEVKQTPMSINRASHLIGTSVKNQNGEVLGTIRDVVFKFQSGRVTYVVLEKAGKTSENEANVAVPLSAFTPSEDHKTLVLNVDKTRFQNAHGFAKNDLPDMNDPIYGAEPKQRILIIPVPVEPNQQQPGFNPDESRDPDGRSIPKVNPRPL